MTLRFEQLLCPKPDGLYCPVGDFYIDPVRPVDRAVITHGHSDHARSGHGSVLATPETLDIMGERYGAEFTGMQQPLRYGESVTHKGVEITLIPAGHVLGSAQAVLRHGGLTMVVSGDYKRRADPTCAPFEPVPCDVFVTEATFGLPVFRHLDSGEEIARLLRSLEQFPGRAHLVGAYALGKAQRVIALLRAAGYRETIFVHGAMQRLNALYERWGVDLGPLEHAAMDAATRKRGDKARYEGAVVVAPPSAIQDRWARNFPDPVACFASGWMTVRGRARQKGVELPLVISDHADWDELTATLSELRPQEVWVTHGREEALVRWCELNGLKGRALALVGYEDEAD